MSRPVGRPRVPKKLAKGSLLSVRFSESERRALEQAAHARWVKPIGMGTEHADRSFTAVLSHLAI